jgi:hypothetical protein
MDKDKLIMSHWIPKKQGISWRAERLFASREGGGYLIKSRIINEKK